jgi:hypothetical protein
VRTRWRVEQNDIGEAAGEDERGEVVGVQVHYGTPGGEQGGVRRRRREEEAEKEGRT